MNDFDRLMQGTVKLRDLSEDEVAALRDDVQSREQAEIEQIPDKTTRELMLKWAKLFPPK